jgi:hypothetical protein
METANNENEKATGEAAKPASSEQSEQEKDIGGRPRNEAVWSECTQTIENGLIKQSCKHCNYFRTSKQLQTTRMARHLVECEATPIEVRRKIAKDSASRVLMMKAYDLKLFGDDEKPELPPGPRKRSLAGSSAATPATTAASASAVAAASAASVAANQFKQQLLLQTAETLKEQVDDAYERAMAVTQQYHEKHPMWVDYHHAKKQHQASLEALTKFSQEVLNEKTTVDHFLSAASPPAAAAAAKPSAKKKAKRTIATTKEEKTDGGNSAAVEV